MVWTLTIITMIFFAANSVLCKAALGNQLIDAGSFTALRLLSGALVLLVIVRIKNPKRKQAKSGSWYSALALFVYAAGFSFAYLSLSTGTGALIMFSAVQITMLSVAIFDGERPGLREWTGILFAFGGLIYLVSPGISAPSFSGSVLMTLSGIAWGVYSLRGRRISDAISETTANFGRATLPAALLFLLYLSFIHATWPGILLAVISGGLASGVGYSIWYTVTTKLTASSAAVIQLTVPVIAALGGVILLGEAISFRLFLSSVIILSGIALALVSQQKAEVISS